MILPPRPQNHRPLDRSRRTLDLPVTVDPPPPQNRPELDRFAVPPWNPRSPEWLAIEDSLPADHRARAIDEAVDQLDLALLFASYLGVGSKAHRPDLMLKIALYEIQTGHHSPDQWAKDTCDRRCLQWLGLGIAPSRSRWYAFRDRVGPLLETFHRQILEGAVAQGLTTASRGSLDGTLIAAHASRHRLVNLSRLRRRLEELDRVIAADKTRQDPGPIPGWMARHPATRQRQRYRFREAQRKLLKEHARNAPPPRPAARRREDRYQYQRFPGRLGPGQREGLPAVVQPAGRSGHRIAAGPGLRGVCPGDRRRDLDAVATAGARSDRDLAQGDLGRCGVCLGLGSVRLRKRMCNCMPPIRRTTGRSSGVPSDRSGRSPRANSSGRPRSRSMCARKDIG